MPKQPPDPIHIRIDTQEQRSGIPDLLVATPQVHIEVIPLRMGDYDVGGDPCRVSWERVSMLVAPAPGLHSASFQDLAVVNGTHRVLCERLQVIGLPLKPARVT